MDMRAFSSVLLSASCLLALPFAADAQTEFRGVEASVGYAGWTGDNVRALDPGVRARLTLFGEASRRLGVGLTGTWAQVPFKDLDENGNEWGVGVTLRQALGDREGLHVFLDGYAGWSQLGLDLGDGSPDQTENGLAIGPGVGIEIPMGSRARLSLGGDFHYYSYDEIRVGAGATEEYDDAGWRYGFQLGFHLATGS